MPRPRKALTVVPDGAAPGRQCKRLTVKQAAESGSRRDLLTSMRARVAAAVDSPATLPRDLAALTRRLFEIAKEIEALDAATGRDDVGEAAATPDEEWAAT